MNLQDVEKVECEVKSRTVTVTFNYEKPDICAVKAVLSRRRIQLYREVIRAISPRWKEKNAGIFPAAPADRRDTGSKARCS